MFDELIGEEEGWTGWYETLLKTRGWFPRGGTYIYRERESCMNFVVKSLGSKMVIIYLERK